MCQRTSPTDTQQSPPLRTPDDSCHSGGWSGVGTVDSSPCLHVPTALGGAASLPQINFSLESSGFNLGCLFISTPCYFHLLAFFVPLHSVHQA